MNLKVMMCCASCKPVCASVLHQYLISDLSYHVPVFHNDILDFDTHLSRWLKVGSTPSKATLCGESGWFGQRRVFCHISSACIENFILFRLIICKLRHSQFCPFLSSFLEFQKWRKCCIILALTLRVTYADESLTRPLFVFERVSFEMISLVTWVKLS